jgi:hypothetical protein
MKLKKGMKLRYIGRDEIAYKPGRIYEGLEKNINNIINFGGITCITIHIVG